MLLTVFTPVYNRADLIRRTYQSLLRQTDKDFEWLVVNDGSTDDGATDAALDDIVVNHDGSFPIVVVRQENGGKHRAVNRGVRMARAPWFIILDSDDILADDAVANAWPSTKRKAEACLDGILATLSKLKTSNSSLL